MKNREKYITKRNEYDLMMAIQHNATDQTNTFIPYCPISVITGNILEGCGKNESCEQCIQHWLNAEAD